LKHDLLRLAATLQDLTDEILGILLLDSEAWKEGLLPSLLDAYEEAQRELRVLVHDDAEVALPGPENEKARATIQRALLGELPVDLMLSEGHGRESFEFSDSEVEAVAQDFLSWYSHYDYARAKLGGASLVLAAGALPEEASGFVGEILECYAFQRYVAVYALARVAMEATLRAVYVREGLANPDSDASRRVRERIESSADLDKGKRKGLLSRSAYARRSGSELSDLTLDDFSPRLFQMIQRLCFLDAYAAATVASGFSGREPLLGVLERIRQRGNSILHGNRTADRESARAMMRDLIRALHVVHEVSARDAR